MGSDRQKEVQIPMRRGNFEEERASHYKAQALWMLCRELCKNDCTDRDAVWVEDSGGPKEPCIKWGLRPPIGRGNFKGERAVRCKVTTLGRELCKNA